MQIQWLVHPRVNCFHLAYAFHQNRVISQVGSNEEMARVVLDLQGLVSHLGVDVDTFWVELIATSPFVASRRGLAEHVLKKLLGMQAGTSVTHLENILIALDELGKQDANSFQTETRMRLDLFQEQWESRGNGLLAMISELTEPGIIAESATVALVRPIRGGFGDVHLPRNFVWLESMLTNVSEDVPEPVRLGWLLAQLQQDIPRYGELIHGARLHWIAKFAMLIPTLLAAAEVEWVRQPLLQVPAALELWLGSPETKELSAALMSWWETYSGGRPAWTTALTALDQMLQ